MREEESRHAEELGSMVEMVNMASSLFPDAFNVELNSGRKALA